MVWIEVGANFNQYANSQENIAADCLRLADGGFTHLVVEVRPTSGDVLFKSSVAPPLKEEALWRPGGLQFVPREADFDYLQAFIDAGHAAGLKVLAGVNVMVGGFRCEAGCRGMLYDYPELRDWAAVDMTPGGLLNHLDDSTSIGGRFLDPANKDVQAFLLQMLSDIAEYKDLDGVVLDRCRYDDYALDAGYTEAAREAFAQYLGREPERWPVFREPGHIFLDQEPDELENKWLTFRCKVIHDFVADAVETMHSVRKDLKVGVYVGAWFSEYYRSGVNWTSPDYPLAQEEETFRWATPEYQATGFANLVDFMLLGAYCPADNIHGDVEKTMEGFARLGAKRLCDEVPFVAGPDIGNQPGFQNGGCKDLLPEIARTMDEICDGCFIFDLCYIRAFDYWDAFKN
ncbi:MAG: family 10 glycosylhydrolase [Bacteroidales bacterium]|nr:family 10 glycosylhydrolase [Bacteroidales bacterium]MBQ7459123.1 family 10 glycosylhydrolase [Bacteroidales bacterium]